MGMLIALGTGVAYLFSIVSLLFTGLLSAQVQDGIGMTPVCFQATAEILVLVLCGHVINLAAPELTGDVLYRRPGENVQMDGIVTERRSSVDLLTVGLGHRLRPAPAGSEALTRAAHPVYGGAVMRQMGGTT